MYDQLEKGGGLGPTVKPRLNFGQVLVTFKDTEEHTAYVKHEYITTWEAYNEYLTSGPGPQRAVLKNKLAKVRYDCYLAWVAGRKPTTEETT